MPNVGASKIGECEVCDLKDVKITVHYGNMWFCDSCWAKEEAASKEHMSPENQQKRVDEYKERVAIDHARVSVIQQSRDAISLVNTRSDIFNAQTVAIVDLKKAIDENPEIVNKPYALAEELTNMHKKFTDSISEHNEAIQVENSKQKAIQVYLNNMANSLRVEEREKLKIADINYKPQQVKPAKPKAITTTGTKKSTKLDKVELNKFAAELGVSAFTLQQIVVARNCSVSDAAIYLRNLKAQSGN